jgi:hypothetical protein
MRLPLATLLLQRVALCAAEPRAADAVARAGASGTNHQVDDLLRRAVGVLPCEAVRRELLHAAAAHPSVGARLLAQV